MLKFLKLININFLVFFSLIFLIESSNRIITLIISCRSKCELNLLTFNPYRRNPYIGIFEKHKILGYITKRDFSSSMNIESSRNIKVSIDNRGFRNSNPQNLHKNQILTVGDSFTFGEGVSDKNTWQSCLNKKFNNKNFINAGVPGYGTAQAIKRAEILYPIIKPKSLLVSTLVGRTFSRDQNSIFSGFPKPYLSSSSNGGAKIENIKTFDIPNTKFSNKKAFNIKDYIIINLTILRKINRSNYFFKLWNNSYQKFTATTFEKGKNYASLDEIIVWSIKKSKSIDKDVIWLLQYDKNFPNLDVSQRTKIRELLIKNNIKFIDTFDALFGSSKTEKVNDNIWVSHHTNLGNKIVCREIIKSNLFQEN